MNNNPSLSKLHTMAQTDLNRTAHPDQQNEAFYWDRDVLVQVGHRTFNMANAISHLSPPLKESFKQHLITFTKQGEYAPRSYTTFISALTTALNSHPTSIFDVHWVAQAMTNSSFHKVKTGIIQFFLHWKERDSAVISPEVLRFLHDTAPHPTGPRNVLSDSPEKSWLTDEEYEALLSCIWDNYDSGTSGVQITLIKLLSMQYARRPIQIAHLKIGDIRESNEDNGPITGIIIDFPGVKDMNAESGFRDGKFEAHPLSDHLLALYQLQCREIRTLYEHTLGFPLNDDQLKKLPLFCSKVRIEKTLRLIEEYYQLSILENLDNKLFHLQELRISVILTWAENTPTCNYDAERRRSSRPKPPISPRTGKPMVVNATRMRHTRARQLARLGVPKHTLSHWLGHTSEKSLDAYYNDPSEQARTLDAAMASVLAPLAMAFAGALIESEDQATRANDPTSKLEFAQAGELKSVGRCGKHSFCSTSSVPIPCYRCKHFEPLVDAPHQEVLDALVQRQVAEKQALKIGGPRNLLIPIDLSIEIRAVENCIARCIARKAEQKTNV
ncbi:site-specific integrase [Pseudomonas aeruginosa]